MTREQMIEQVTEIIVAHNLPDYGHNCAACKKELYGQGNGRTLSRHRAEVIVDKLTGSGLVSM